MDAALWAGQRLKPDLFCVLFGTTVEAVPYKDLAVAKTAVWLSGFLDAGRSKGDRLKPVLLEVQNFVRAWKKIRGSRRC